MPDTRKVTVESHQRWVDAHHSTPAFRQIPPHEKSLGAYQPINHPRGKDGAPAK